MLTALTGCYAPDLSKTRYRCSVDFPLCPGDLQCFDGCCGGGKCTPDSPFILPDGSITTSDDMAQWLAADMLTIDPYAWSPTQPAGVAAGCANGRGWRLGSDKLWACPGNYDYPKWGQQCAPGFAAPATLTIPESACASVPWGFFVSLAHGLDTQRIPTSAMRPDWNAPDASWKFAFRLGCGKSGQGWNGSLGFKVYTFTSAVKPGGFPTAALCTGQVASGGDTPWICDATQYPYREIEFPAQTALVLMSDGVLCAAP